MSPLVTEYLAKLRAGQQQVAVQLIIDAAAAGRATDELYLDVLAPAMSEVGRLWQTGELTVAEEHYCTAATHAAISQLYTSSKPAQPTGKSVVVAAVPGDFHVIGLHMVSNLLEDAGWTAHFLGGDVPTQALVAFVVDKKPDLVALGASLGLHVGALREAIEALGAHEATARIPILVGGAPFNENPTLFERVGADAHAASGHDIEAVASRTVRSGRRGGRPHLERASALSKPVALDSREPEGGSLGGLTRLNLELVAAQRVAVQHNHALERANEEKNRVLGMAAHDLRTPLTVIQKFSAFLHEDLAAGLGKEQLEFLDGIRSSSTFMIRLIDDMLDFSTVESGKVTLRLERVDLVELLEECVGQNALLGSKKRIRVTLTTQAETLAVTADGHKLKQVMNNFLSNGLKFSREGSHIDVRLTLETGRAVIRVVDEGPGIPVAEMNLLFKPFSTTSVRSTQGEKSTGLGLAIVKRIVNAHHGQVGVESQVGVGSTFWFDLPA